MKKLLNSLKRVIKLRKVIKQNIPGFYYAHFKDGKILPRYGLPKNIKAQYGSCLKELESKQARKVRIIEHQSPIKSIPVNQLTPKEIKRINTLLKETDIEDAYEQLRQLWVAKYDLDRTERIYLKNRKKVHELAKQFILYKKALKKDYKKDLPLWLQNHPAQSIL